MRLITESQVIDLMDMELAVDSIHRTFKELHDGKVINPPKVNLDLGQSGDYPYFDGFINAMPAYVEWVHMAGLKWVVGMGGKRKELGLPYINSILVLADPETGEFQGVLSGTYISNIRTGAQSAVALHELLPNQDTISVGMFGAGIQARTQVEAISTRFQIEDLTVYNHRLSTAEKFAEEMQEYVTNPIKITTNPEEATDHEVLITVTHAQEPFLTRSMVKPGTIIMPMGSFQEISDDLILATDKLYVDHIEQSFHRGALKGLYERGEIDFDMVTATFDELVAVDSTPLPNMDKDITITIPIGTGALDVTLAGIVYERAIEKNIGTEFDITK